MTLRDVIDAVQIFLFIAFAIAIIVCFVIFFGFAPKSDWGNWGGFFLFLGAFNALIMYDRWEWR